MLFNNRAEKETAKILLQENKRLKRENLRLTELLDKLQEYKNEYNILITEMKQIKETYVGKMKEFEEMKEIYKKELDKIVKITTLTP